MFIEMPEPSEEILAGGESRAYEAGWAAAVLTYRGALQDEIDRAEHWMKRGVEAEAKLRELGMAEEKRAI